MYDIQKINSSVPHEGIVNYLCSALGTTSEQNGTQTKIKGQGGLFVDEQGRIARPGDGEGSGGHGILTAVIFCETGGKWNADKETFKRCLDISAGIAGISPAEKTPVKKTPPKQHQPKEMPPVDFNKPTKIYAYTDEAGVELYQNCRFEWVDKNGNHQKTFRQRHRVKDRWVYTLEGVRSVPFRLQALLSEPDLICDCEGEKDVESLQGLGLTATNMAKLKDDEFKEFAKIAAGKTVAVFEDNDDAGRKSAEKRCRLWYKSGAGVKRISFMDMPEKADVSDWIQADKVNHDVFELRRIINATPEYHPLSDILVSFNHKPTRRAPIVTIKGQHMASEGELFGIVSGIGTGKSHLIETFAALLINPECEPESYTQVSLAPGEKCILIDNERTEDDCYYALERIWKKSGQNPGSRSSDRMFFKDLHIAHTTHLKKEERQERLLEAFQVPNLKLLLLDGALGFIRNPNDTEQCIEFVEFLHQMANKYNVAVVYTIHGNRNDDSGKAKGWLGAELQRLSSSLLRLMKHPNQPEIRLLTSEFDNVKVRQGKDSGLTIAMTWSEEHHDFRCIPVPGEGGKPSQEEYFDWCFAKSKDGTLSKAELAKIYMEIADVTKQTAYRHIGIATGTILGEEISDLKVVYRFLGETF